MVRFVIRAGVFVTVATGVVGGSSAWAQGHSVPAKLGNLEAAVWQNATVTTLIPRNDSNVFNNWTLATLASLSLPEGSYLIEAKSTVQEPTNATGQFYCALVRSGSTEVIDASFDETYSQGTPTNIILLGVATLTGTETVTFQCGASGDPAQPSAANAFVSKLVAIRANIQE